MNKEMKMLKCGCTGMATHHNAHDGLEPDHPSCIVHECCEVAETPDLSGRMARCIYYGKDVYKSECDDCRGLCGCEKKSSINLAFFEYHPEEKYDRYYCGCHGWD